MQRKAVYLVLMVIGAVVPMVAFVPWLVENGLNLRLLVAELFVNRVSTFFALDLLLTGCAVAVFARAEARRVKGARLVILVMLLIGVSAALPLLLFLREKKEEQAETVLN